MQKDPATLPWRSSFIRAKRVCLHLLLASGCITAATEAQALESHTIGQMEAIMAEKAARTKIQLRLDSQLWYAAREKKFGRAIPGAPGLRSNFLQGSDRVVVDITAAITPHLVREISRLGGKLVNAQVSLSAMRAEVPIEALEPLAAQAEVVSIRAADEYTLHSVGTQMEGVVAHRVPDARVAFPADGAGIKIGVLSDSLDHLKTLQDAGLLPTITVLPGQGGGAGTGEGTAMLQIIHSMAPGAQLYFATALGGVATFAQNVRALRAAGCQVIVDDVLYFSESPFQDGPVAQAVNDVTASGALYFAAAGNGGSAFRGTGATWEGDFKDGGAATPGRGGRLHDFGGTNANFVLPSVAAGRVDLFWADPLGKAQNDYDAYVLDSNGNVLAASTDVQNGTQDPWEKIGVLNSGQRVVIVKYAGKERYLHLNTGRAYLQHSTPGATRGHNAQEAANSFGVAAIKPPSPVTAFKPAPANPTERYSSDGPRRIFFSPDGTPLTPNNFSSTGGKVLNKPDLAAAAGVTTAVPGFAPFDGTSAAAPHGAAIAALIWSHRPTLNATEVAQVLRASALDVDSPGLDPLSGVGVAMAYESLSYDQPTLVIQRAELRDANNSGTLDPNECADLLVTIVNEAAPGRQTALGLAAILQTSAPNLRIDPAPRFYGDLPADGSTAVTATFKISTTEGFSCGTKVPLQLQVQCSNPYATTLPVLLEPLAIGVGAPVRFSAANLPQPVPDPGALDSTVQVSGFDQKVAKVRVGIHVTHPYVTDLKISLLAPDGTQSVLTINAGASGNNFGLSCDEVMMFTDDATRSVATALPPYTGEFLPQQSFAAFAGKSGTAVNGLWTLRVQDQFEPDAGALQCWWLELLPNTCGTGTGQCLVPPSITQAPGNQTLTNGNTAVISALVQGTEPLTYTWYFNATNLLPVPNSPTLELPNVTSTDAGVYALKVTNPYGTASASATLAVVVRPTIACAPERTVSLGEAWDLITPSATGTNVVVTLSSTTTNAAPCGASHSVTFTWQAVDAGGFTAVCDQVVHFQDRAAPALTCADQVAVVGEPWDFEFPMFEDPGDPRQILYGPQSLTTESWVAAGAHQLGDEITLGPGGRIPVRFALSYSASNSAGPTFTGSPAARVRFYLNDGDEFNTLTAPGTLLFDSGPLALSAVGTGTIWVDNFGSGSAAPLLQPLPDELTWTVQFEGLGTGDTVSIASSTASITGQSAAWFWQNGGTGWTTGTNAPGNRFAAQLQTIQYPIFFNILNTTTNAGCQAGYEVTRTIEVADACGNKSVCTQKVTVLDPVLPQIVTQPQSVEVLQGESASFSVTAGPCGPYEFQWIKNLTNALANATNATFEFTNVTASLAGDYSAIVSTPFGTVTSTVATLTVLVPARITREPADVLAGEGETAQFNVRTTGTPPLTYFWYFNKTNLLPSATTATLEIPSVTPADAGTYSVVVSNAYGKDTSRQAKLQLVYPPVIVTTLTNILATNGQTLSFEIEASGSQPLSFAWFLNTTNLLAGETNSSLVLSNVVAAHEGLYTVVVSNSNGESSSSALLSVFELPQILGGLGPQSINPGETAAFSVTATGSAPLSYQWYAPSGQPLVDETNMTLVLVNVTAAQGGQYRVDVTNPYGTASGTAELRILGPPVIVSGPASLTLNSGEVATLSVNAQGSEPLTYFWFQNGSLLSGINTPQLTFNPVTSSHAGEYRVMVSNPLASTMSDPALLKVIAPAIILTQPDSQVVSNGTPASFSAVVDGEPPISFHWFFNETNGLAATPGPELQIPLAGFEHAGSYTLVVSNVYTVVTSTPAQLTVVLPLRFLQQPVSQAVDEGAPVEFAVEAEGTGPLSYVWFRDGSPLPNASANRLVLDSVGLDDAGTYHVVVTTPYGTGTSDPAQLVVIAPPEVVGPTNIVATNGTDVTFSVIATGTPPLQFQWYFGEALLTTQTNTVLELHNVAVADAGSYSVVVQNPYGTVTNSATLTVLVELTIACAPERTVELGANWEFLSPDANGVGVVVTAIETTTNLSCGGSFTATRVWEARDTHNDTVQCTEIVRVVDTTPPAVSALPSKTFGLGESWEFDVPSGQDLSGVVTASIASTATNLICGAGYEAVRSWDVSDPCQNITQVSQIIAVEDRNAPTLVTGPTPQEVVEGSSFSLSVTVTACPPFTYQWYYNETNLIPDATNSTLAFPSVNGSQAGLYSVTVSNAFGGLQTQPALVTVRVPAQFLSGPANLAVESGEDAIFSVSVRGTDPVSLQWFGNNDQPIPGATGPSLTLAAVQPAQAGSYRITASNAWGQVSRSALLDVLVAPQITGEPQDRSVPIGATVSFSVTAAANPPPQYQWFFNLTNAIPNATQFTLTIAEANSEDAGEYSVRVSNSVGEVWSRAARLSLTEAPLIVQQPASATNYQGETAVFTATAAGAPPLGYQWFFQATNLLVGATSPTLTLPNLQFAQSGQYTLLVTNASGSIVSQPATLRVLVLPQVTSVTKSNNLVTITITTEPNLLYSVYWTANLGVPGSWTLLPKAVQRVGTGAPMKIEDSQASDTQRFYSIVVE